MNNLDYSKVFEVLVTETKNYVKTNNLKAMVLGISGGIDSTVVAAICHEVSKQTGIPLIGRSLPIKNKNDEFDTSKLVGKAFCNNFEVTNLYEVFNKFLTLVDGDNLTSLRQTPIADGNIQARLRMIYLYNLASIYNGLVISTDNQTEYQLGFWTIHGDVGDFDPIQGLWKTEVYELAKWLIGYYYGCGIKKEVDADGARKICDMCEAIKKSMSLTPTDGLGISNSDLEQIGAKSYNEVDDILKTLISCESSEETYMLAGNVVHIQANKKSDLYKKYGEDVVNKVWSRHLASEFKREKAPIYILREKYN
jgi:NAD+ synthetase